VNGGMPIQARAGSSLKNAGSSFCGPVCLCSKIGVGLGVRPAGLAQKAGPQVSTAPGPNKFFGHSTCTKIHFKNRFPENVVEELQRHLNRVRTITGSLKIARSFPIVSLDFFQNLEEIQVLIYNLFPNILFLINLLLLMNFSKLLKR
jgi:hypothetical protein